MQLLGGMALDLPCPNCERVLKVPESYLVSPDGIVVAKIIGGVDAEGLEAILDEAQGAAG